MNRNLTIVATIALASVLGVRSEACDLPPIPVVSPYPPGAVPLGTAICPDGTCSYDQDDEGCCIRAWWWDIYYYDMYWGHVSGNTPSISLPTVGWYYIELWVRDDEDTWSEWGAGFWVAVVDVDRIQYNDPLTSWTDTPDPLYVFKGTTVAFKALTNPSGAPWPYGYPVWGGSAGATGTGETKSVTFNTVSSSTSDYKTVTATCANTVTVNVLVYDLTGNLVPNDNFSGRSQTDYGLEELAGLSYTTSPSGISGLPVQWTIESGVGTLNSAHTIYDAGPYNGDVRLQLWITSGPSYGMRLSYERTVVAPTGAYMIQEPGTGIWHVHNTCSCGFLGYSYITPKDVSFTNLETREGDANATASGFYAELNNAHHEPGIWRDTSNGNIATGCKAGGEDQVQLGGIPPYEVGSFLWPIPLNYRASDGVEQTLVQNQNHLIEADAAGKCTISKNGAGPFSKNAADPDSWY